MKRESSVNSFIKLFNGSIEHSCVELNKIQLTISSPPNNVAFVNLYSVFIAKSGELANGYRVNFIYTDAIPNFYIIQIRNDSISVLFNLNEGAV